MYNQLDLYEKYKIHSFEGLIMATRDLTSKIESIEKELEKRENEYSKKVELNKWYETYMKYYNH